MRRAVRVNQGRQRVSRTSSIPAPVAGWNARDSIAAMKSNEAVILDNWFPTASKIIHRKGSAEYATAITDGADPAIVETLAVYKPPSGDEEFYAWADEFVYDVSAPGDVGAAVVSSLTNSRWQHINATTSGGNFLIAVNGADDLLLYDGSNWTPVDGVSTPAITGVTTSALVNLNQHKNRVWYIPVDSLTAYYTAAGAITGAVTAFPLGGVFRAGGYLMAMGTWTIDGGSGVDDLAVFVTSEGEVAVYQGTDPADASAWSLVGVYTIGTPIGRRCLVKLGGDLLIITTDGVISASQYFVTARTDKSVAITDRIQTAMAEAVDLYGDNFGWEMTFYPGGSMLLLNVPVTEETEQFVMNTITRAWCRFTDWNAECFAVYNDELYFGMLGEVRKAWTGTADLTDEIESEVLQAYSYFGNRNQQKHFRMVRPILGWDVNPARIRLGVDVDFQVTTPTGEITPTGGSNVLIWDTGQWDVNVWGGDEELNKLWYSVYGIGFAGALHMLVSSSSASISYSACDVLWESGEVI